MPRQQLPFRSGLERSAGELVASPAGQRDPRNVLVEEGSLRVRGGLENTGWPALPWGTDTVCITPFVRNRDWLVVQYDRPTRELRVYKINPTALTVQLVGNWITLNAACSPLPPVIVAAEHSGRVFFAHAEPAVNVRAHTVYYTPGALDTDAGTLTALAVDLDGNASAEQLKFFTILAWGAFLLGAGYGDGTTPDAPGMLRLSFPGDPLDWPQGSFVDIGGRTDPIIGMASADDFSRPIFAKRSETYTLLGNHPADFQPQLLDAHRGVANARLIAGWAGRVWMWDEEGPMVTTGDAAPERLERGLGLDDAAPADLGLDYLRTWAFMVADEQSDALYVMFPDATDPATSTAGVVFSMGGGTPSWSYVDFPVGLLCAGRGPTNKAPPPPVTGYASAVAVADLGPVGGYRRGRVTWANNSFLGDEGVDLFVKVGGVWSLLVTVPVSGASQTYDIDTLGALTAGNVALRLSRGSAVLGGYEGSDPDAWSGATVAGAKAAYTMGCDTPTIHTATWQRTSASAHQHTLGWSTGALDVGFEIDAAASGAGPWTTVLTLPATGNPRTAAIVLSIPELATRRYYRLRAVRGALFSSYAATVDRWAGPAEVAPTWAGLYQQDGALGVTPDLIAFIQPCDAVLQIRLEQQDNASAWQHVVTVPGGNDAQLWGYAWRSKRTGYGTTRARAKFAQTTFGVTDFGPDSADQVIGTVNAAAPGLPSYFIKPTSIEVGGTTQLIVDGVQAFPAGHIASYEGPLLIPGTSVRQRVLEVFASGVGLSDRLFVTVGPQTTPYSLGSAFPEDPGLTFYSLSGAILSAAFTKVGVSGQRRQSWGRAAYLSAVTQPTPGVGTAEVTVRWLFDVPASGAIGYPTNAVILWRDDSSPFSSWNAGGTVVPAPPLLPPAVSVTGLPRGIPLRFRVVGNYLGAWQDIHPFPELVLTLS